MKLVFIDDDKSILSSIELILKKTTDYNVFLGEDYIDGIKLFNSVKPDIMFLDIELEKSNGIDLAKDILALKSNQKIVFLTTFLNDEYIYRSLELGVNGYILKKDFDSITKVVEAVANGQNVFGTKIVEKLPNILYKRFDPKEHNITQRELSVIEYVSKGYNNKEISDKLFLSEGTIRNYISEILSKLNLRDRTQLAVFYYQNRRKDD